MNSDVTHQPPIELSRKARMKDGLLPIVAVAGAVSVALLWSMSAQDPYWRLFQSTDAPTYGQNAGSGTILANEPMEYGNADTGSMSPSKDMPQESTQPYGLTGVTSPSSADARNTTIPSPMIALTHPAEPRSLSDPTINLDTAYGPPRAAVPARVGLRPGDAAFDGNASELVVAFAPTPLPAPMALRDRIDNTAAVAASGYTLDPFVAPPPPAQPRVASSMNTEEALELKRSQRVDVQRRLALAGFNPHGLDGVFGLRTRAAITDFQTAWGFPATGYLDISLITDLNQRTEDAYIAWRHQVAAARKAAPQIAPVANERQLANGENEGQCLRDANGRILERQSLACDIAGFGESFISLGRNTLNNEDGESTAGSGASHENNSSSIDR